jgi:sigma-B regulation protein RsbU (phosphoserine phosphatase)
MQYNKSLYKSILLLSRLSFLLTKAELSIYSKLQEVTTILANALEVRRCSLVLYNRDTKRFEIVAATGLNIPVNELRKMDPLQNSPIIRYVINNKLPVIVRDDNDMKKLGIEPKKNYKIQSFISVPLIANSQFLGVMNITDTISNKPFTDIEANTVTILSDHIATTILNAQLSEEIIKNQIIKEQLAIARDVQFSLLPDDFPNNSILEMFGFTEPTYDVGGDYFDILEKDNRYNFIVADVSGKGIPASLIMTSFRSFWRAFTSSIKSPQKVLAKLNNTLVNDLDKSSIFITCFSGSYNPEKRLLTYCNAAHEFPIYFSYKRDKFMSLNKNNTIIGAFPNLKYRSFLKKTEPSDILILYSDGITDFKFRRKIDIESQIMGIVKENKTLPVKEIVLKIRQLINNYLEGYSHTDDLTLLMLRFK